MTEKSNYETLGVEVTVLQKEMGEVKATVGQLSGKIDTAVSDLGREMRRAIDALGATINERAKTPWGVIWPALGVIITLLIFIGNQALSPTLKDVQDLKASIVTRTEHETRWQSNDVRLNKDEAEIASILERRYKEREKQIDEATAELKETRQASLKELQDRIDKSFARDHDELTKSNEELRAQLRQLSPGPKQ